MKIRTQNLIAIVPIFLALGLASGALVYTTAHGELLWGLREEAASLAVTVAELIDGDRLSDHGAEHEYLRAVERPLRRLLRGGQARRIYLFAADGSGPLLDLGDIPRTPPDWAPLDWEPALPDDPRFWAAMANEREFLSTVQRLAAATVVLMAYAPVSDSKGQLKGVLGVVTDASSLSVRMWEIMIRIGKAAGAVALLGILVAVVISAWLTGSVQRLHRAAAEVASGRYDQKIGGSGIRELGELGNTLDTMRSVLQYLRHKHQRSLMNRGDCEPKAGLAATYRSAVWKPVDTTLGARRVIARTLGTGCPGDFYDVVRLADGQCCVFAGCINRSDLVVAAVEASAARTVITKELATRPPEEALAAAAELFRPSRLNGVYWDPKTGEGQVIDGCGPASSCGIARQPLPKGRTTLLHSFEPHEGEMLDRHHMLFRGLAVNELARALEGSLDTALCGQLIVIDASASVSATSRAQKAAPC